MKKFCAVCRFFLCCSCLTGMPFSAEASLCTWGPKNFEKGQARELKCDFQAPVHKVYWYKDNELITNGTEGLYQSYDQLDDDTLRSTLRFPTVHVHHEGIYTCKADTNQNSSCPEGLTVEVSVFCARGHITAANKLVYAEQFSNRSLRCSALTPSDCSFGEAKLQWYYRNRTLQSGGKYMIREHKYSECRRRLLQAEFILEIYNVTAHDAGEYLCQMECISFFTTTEKDSIELVTLLKPPGGGNPFHIALCCFIIKNELYFLLSLPGKDLDGGRMIEWLLGCRTPETYNVPRLISEFIIYHVNEYTLAKTGECPGIFPKCVLQKIF